MTITRHLLCLSCPSCPCPCCCPPPPCPTRPETLQPHPRLHQDSSPAPQETPPPRRRRQDAAAAAEGDRPGAPPTQTGPAAAAHFAAGAVERRRPAGLPPRLRLHQRREVEVEVVAAAPTARRGARRGGSVASAPESRPSGRSGSTRRPPISSSLDCHSPGERNPHGSPHLPQSRSPSRPGW